MNESDSPSNQLHCRGSMINSEDDTWVTVAMAVVVLPLCAYFLVNTWKRWLAAHRRTGSSSIPSTPTGSSHQPGSAGHRPSTSGPPLHTKNHGQSHTTESSAHGQHSINTIRSATSSVMLAIQGSWIDSIKYWGKKMFRPRGLNQLLGNLLLSSWTILALDQFFHVIFILCVTLVCPSYNCRNYHSFATPGCLAGLFEGLQLIIQPFGSCCFIVATVNRFVNVYSQLSRRRHIALRVGTTIVCLVCIGMSIVTAMAYSVLSSPTSTREQAAQAHELLLLGDFITYSSIGIVSILALVMGLEYIIKIRKEVSALRPSIATPSIFQPKEPQQPSLAPAQIKTSAPLASPSTSPSLDPLPSASSLQPIHHSTAHVVQSLPRPERHSRAWHAWERMQSKDGRQSLTTVLCIFINISIIVMFLTEHPYLKAKASKEAGATAPEAPPSSALFDSAFMSMCHKVFSATVTVAIHQMTDLVLSKNRKH